MQKAEAYVGAIRAMDMEDDRIAAQVKGTARRPYRVAIAFGTGHAEGLSIHATCTCPVGHHCKHAAAVLMAGLRSKEGAAAINPSVLKWLEGFRSVVSPPAETPCKQAATQEVLFYVLERPSAESSEWRISFQKGRLSKDGSQVLSLSPWNNVERALVQPPRFLSESDVQALRLLWASRNKQGYQEKFPLRGGGGEDLLRRLLASSRLCCGVGSREALTLKEGDPRAGQLEWRHAGTGELVPLVTSTPPIDAVLPLVETWYVDNKTRTLGLLQVPIPTASLAALLAVPPLSEVDVPVVAAALAELAPNLAPPEAAPVRVIKQLPVPVLTLGTVEVFGIGSFRQYRYNARIFDYAVPAFRYADLLFDIEQPIEFVVTPEGETVRVKRNLVAEVLRLKELGGQGLAKVPARSVYTYNKLPSPLFGLESERHWPEFMAKSVPALRAEGWEVVIPPGFRHRVLEVETWQAEFREDDDGWFALDMGIVVDGRRLALAPLLHDLFRRDPRWLDASELKRLPDGESIEVTTPQGERIRIPAGRLKPLARTLIDLFDDKPNGVLRMSRLDAARLGEVAALDRWQFKGAEAVKRLAHRLQQSRGVKTVQPPQGLTLQLRPYQLEGVAWLQFLREQELGGILADDMGLGKTAQTLAHLLLEKEAGRLDRPALVVVPTSLIFNWKREADRFAPDLKVLSLHGKDRKDRFGKIPDFDVALTTYPLLWRDQEELAGLQYRWLILDEAQMVKNAASQAAQVVRKLDASHRLCLTGTPLENHLGELWAQFDFLLPGFLGDTKSFTRSWRTPIEKHGDQLRRNLLARRLKPFILRRRKDEVAKELPPKSVIVRTVELEAGQRDLYETVRSAMNAKVLEAIAEKGFARSHIVILDALLKLRQVCCDPRLLRNEEAGKVRERAKLDLLMDMLPELVDEGRRILVFSQFTSMLDLIGRELERKKLHFVILTGDTRNREHVIQCFQNGDVPLFLISLKAGGVGLNLTAADTVIHFDPWWNPAVENQATDRAHRIGQTKPVFVYKLVVAGSIEEKILALQEKKADLAAGVLSEDAEALTKFSESDIQALLAPLP